MQIKYLILILFVLMGVYIMRKIEITGNFIITDVTDDLLNLDNKFKNLLGQMESAGNYSAKNSIGALGKYQFMIGTIAGLKKNYPMLPVTTPESFLKNPDVQEKYMDYAIIDYKKFINVNNLDNFYGKAISGSMRFTNLTASINRFGIMAGLHLAGAGNVKRYFSKEAYNPNDGNTSLSDYITYFSKNV
jgi:hypothetical protein